MELSAREHKIRGLYRELGEIDGVGGPDGRDLTREGRAHRYAVAEEIRKLEAEDKPVTVSSYVGLYRGSANWPVRRYPFLMRSDSWECRSYDSPEAYLRALLNRGAKDGHNEYDFEIVEIEVVYEHKPVPPDRSPIMTDIPDGYTLLRVTSHRAWDRLERVCGERPLNYFSWTEGAAFALVPDEHVEAALKIPSINRPRASRLMDVMLCWSDSERYRKFRAEQHALAEQRAAS